MRLCGAHGGWRNSAWDAVFFLITNHQFNTCHHATFFGQRQKLTRFHVRTLTIRDHHNAIHFRRVKCQRSFLSADQLRSGTFPSERYQRLRSTGQVEGEFVLGSSKWTRILLNNKEAFVHSALVSRSRPSNSARPTATTALRTVSRAPNVNPNQMTTTYYISCASPRQRAQLPAHHLQPGRQLRARRGGRRAATRLRRFSQRQFELAGGEAQQWGGLHPRAPAFPDPTTTSASPTCAACSSTTTATTTSSTGSGQRAGFPTNC